MDGSLGPDAPAADRGATDSAGEEDVPVARECGHVRQLLAGKTDRRHVVRSVRRSADPGRARETARALLVAPQGGCGGRTHRRPGRPSATPGADPLPGGGPGPRHDGRGAAEGYGAG